MKKVFSNRVRSWIAPPLSVFLAFTLPAASFAQVAAQVAPVRSGPTVAPVALQGAGALTGSPMSLSVGRASLGSGSVLPSLSETMPTLSPSVNTVRTLAPAASVSPVLSVSRARALPAQGLTTKALSRTAPKEVRRVSARTRAVSNEVGAALEAAGPVAQAAPETAHGLGSRLLSLLTGSAARGGSGPVAAPGVSRMSSSEGPSLRSSSRAPLNPTQKKMIKVLDYVASVYTEHYAPVEWKKDSIGVDFKREYQKARKAITSNPRITYREFQDALAAFVAATKDYHTGITFYSTERSRLPIYVMSAGGKYYIAYIDRSALPESRFPFQPGDEIVEFGGRPVDQVVQGLVKANGENVKTTDQRLAEMQLTTRIRMTGAKVPQGRIPLKIRAQTGELRTVELEWEYHPESVPQDIPVRDAGFIPEKAPGGIEDVPESFPEPVEDSDPAREALRKLIPWAAHPHAEAFDDVAAQNQGNPFMIGARKSFVPKLGRVVWQIDSRAPLHAYVFENGQGRRIGYLRIPSYMGDEKMAGLAAQVINKLDSMTDALVIDQINNPGGSVFYMYQLLSMLTGRPLEVPRHQMLIDESDAFWAAQVLERSRNQSPFRAALRHELLGFSLENTFIQPIVRFARFIISELRAGRRLTKLTHLMGVDKITPNPQVRYTKPLLVLVNELDFSAGDFFPAILQDNKRATLLGVRTSGAGGSVKPVQFPNQFGIAQLSYTWTLAIRRNGKPIENIGVHPDIDYQITPQDLRSGFQGYRRAILKAIDGLLGDEGQPVRPQRTGDPRRGGPTVIPIRFVD